MLDKSQKHKTVPLLLGLCALVFCFWGVFSSGLVSIVIGLGLFALGIPVYTEIFISTLSEISFRLFRWLSFCDNGIFK
jgi:hypothetical protein